MHQASVNGVEGSLQIPPGSTTLTFVYRSKKNGKENVARITPGPKRNHFIALFDEDDVDFEIGMKNSSMDRSVCFHMNILNERRSFMTEPNRTWRIETLHSNGRKLHFGRQSDKLISEIAANHGLSRHDASVMLSEIEFNVIYSEQTKYPILVKISNGESITIAVNASNTVADMKSTIRFKKLIALDDQVLRFGGVHFDNDAKTMEELGVTEHSTVNLTGKIIFRDVTVIPENKIARVAFTSLDTVDQFKTKIEKQEGISVCQRTLYCNGIELNGRRIPESYLEGKSPMFLLTNVENGSTNTPHVCCSSSMFTVNVTNRYGELVPVPVCGLDTVKELISKVVAMESVSASNDDSLQCYIGSDGIRRLDKLLPLMVYSLNEDSQLVIRIPEPAIFIKTLTGKTKCVPYCPTLSVDSIQLMIQETEGIPVPQQRLIFGGKMLESGYGYTLSDYGVSNQSTLHLVLNLRGGGGECGCRHGELCENHAKQNGLDIDFSERGAITFGGKSQQQFSTSEFNVDRSIEIESFVVELRLTGVPLLI